MTAERCRPYRESLGAYLLGGLADDERPGLEAHLEGCAECRAEADSLLGVASLLPHADPDRFGPAPAPPAALGKRIAATIGAEKRKRRRRHRFRLGLGLSGAAAVATAAVLAVLVLSESPGSGPEQRVAFRSLPTGVTISATLEPQAFGTEIRMYVKGVRSGTLCRVYMRGIGGTDVSAGTFRYRWGADTSAVLSAALDLSRARALVVHAGNRTFVAPIDAKTAMQKPTNQEEPT
jgi:hypothetical protein